MEGTHVIVYFIAPRCVLITEEEEEEEEEQKRKGTEATEEIISMGNVSEVGIFF